MTEERQNKKQRRPSRMAWYEPRMYRIVAMIVGITTSIVIVTEHLVGCINKVGSMLSGLFI